MIRPQSRREKNCAYVRTLVSVLFRNFTGAVIHKIEPADQLNIRIYGHGVRYYVHDINK